jgi:hypothetical protein
VTGLRLILYSLLIADTRRNNPNIIDENGLKGQKMVEETQVHLEMWLSIKEILEHMEIQGTSPNIIGKKPSPVPIALIIVSTIPGSINLYKVRQPLFQKSSIVYSEILCYTYNSKTRIF